jgi:hypothetical protein
MKPNGLRKSQTVHRSFCYHPNEIGVKEAAQEASDIDLNEFRNGTRRRNEFRGKILRDTYDSILTVMEKKHSFDNGPPHKRTRNNAQIPQRFLTPEQPTTASNPSFSGSSAESTMESESQGMINSLLRDVLYIGTSEIYELSWLPDTIKLEIQLKLSL